MKRAIRTAALVATAATAAMIFTGCAVTTESKIGDGQVTSRYVPIRSLDGTSREVACVFWVPVHNNGVATPEGAQMECDFGGTE